MMKHKLFYLFFICCFSGCKGQDTQGMNYLQLVKVVPMPGVKGRIDHIAVNLKDQRIYVAALGNNSVEVIDLQKGAVVHSIKAVDEPQGVAYIPEQNEIVVANGGNGNCTFYNAATYALISTLHLPEDADNVRYQASAGKIYVGYGNGGIAVIDALSHKLIGDIKLPAHPESFQIDQKNNLLYVNLPDASSIAVISLTDRKLITTWNTSSLKANFPMALDTADSRVIIGYRHPAVLVVYDGKTGKEISRAALVHDVDDIFYDEMNHQIIASGGEGYINIFKKDKSNIYKKVANIPARPGARTSLLIPSLDIFIVAERNNGSKAAAIAVYKINDTQAY
jgi:YVTN family beta-propeller protein